MKNKFYSFINFLSCELHFFEYLFYMILIGILFYLYDYYNFSIIILEYFIYFIIGMAFMNTWEIKSKKYKKGVDDNERKRIEK